MLKTIGLLALLCLTLGIAAAVYGNAGFNRNSSIAEIYYKSATTPQAHRKRCNSLYNKRSEQVSCRSVHNPNTEKTQLFLWGDSHASMLVHGLEEMAKKYKFNLEYSILPGCLASLKMQRSDRNINCSAAHDRVAEHIKSSNFPLVLLASSYVHNTVTGRSRSIYSPRKIDPTNSVNEFAKSIEQTVNTIKSTGAKAVVITEPPRHAIDPVIENVKQIMVGRSKARIQISIDDHEKRIGKIYRIIDDSGVDLRLDYSRFYCKNKLCGTQLNQMSLYADKSHLSHVGSIEITKRIITDLKSQNYF
jgi:hypothetical protein